MIMHSSGCGHQHHRGNQGRGHPRPTLVKCKPQHMHIPLIADLKDREPNMVAPFVIINFSHHEHLHLPKDHIVAFAEKDCNEGEVLEICTMQQL